MGQCIIMYVYFYDLSRAPDYDHEYLPAVDILVPVIWQDPRSATEKINHFINDTFTMINVVSIGICNLTHVFPQKMQRYPRILP
jgi:hypothetical protein